MSDIKIDIELTGLNKLQHLVKKAAKLGANLEKTIQEIKELELHLEVKKPDA